jgi:hypothetical protein
LVTLPAPEAAAVPAVRPRIRTANPTTADFFARRRTRPRPLTTDFGRSASLLAYVPRHHLIFLIFAVVRMSSPSDGRTRDPRFEVSDQNGWSR